MIMLKNRSKDTPSIIQQIEEVLAVPNHPATPHEVK